jgi:uncharacterized protein YbjT (DUF2867 family)
VSELILGATGFVGREVVRQLCVRGSKVIAHVRPDSSKLGYWTREFSELGATVDTSRWDAAELATALKAHAVDRLYILIGTTKAKAKSDRLDGNIYEQIDLGLTKIAVDAAKASGRAMRIIYLSAIGADAGARGAYMRARGQAEDVVRGSGLPWVLARPSLIVGEREESRLAESAGAVIGDGLLAVAGVLGGKTLRAKYRSTTPDVLASALIRIAEASAHDRAYEGSELR